MKIAPKAANEDKRLENLYEYKILDTLPEKDLDDFTFLASQICQAPVALISLVDKDRQWFKSKIGIEASETHRDLAFCAHAILGNDVMMIPDSHLDERFSDNPLAHAPTNVRFYAGAPLTTPSGYNIGTLCVIDEVPRKLTTEQIKSLSALARQVVNHFELRLQNESILRSSLLIESSPWAIICKDYKENKGVFVEWNKAAEMVSGFKAEDVLGKNAFDYLDEQEAKETQEEDLSILKTGIPTFNEKKMVQTKDHNVWVKNWKVPVKDKNGDSRYLLSLLIDITKEVELEEKLIEKNLEVQKTAQRLDLALSGANLGIWDWNLENNNVVFDQRWCQMLGLDVNKIKMELKTWEERVHPADLANCYRDIDAYLKGKTQSYENIHRMKHTNGEWVYILDRGRFSEWDSNGKPIRFTGTHFDVTLLKKLESELRARTLEAESATKVKSEFLANMGHEIRTPMNGILGMAKLLIDSTKDVNQLENLKIIQKSADALLHLLNDVLDFSKMEAGKMTFQKKSFSLSELAYEVVALFGPSAHEKKLKLNYHHDTDIPVYIQTDDVRLRQVLSNLISNAIKFTFEGDVFVESKLIKKENKTCIIEFKVKDSGVGIPLEFQDKLFKSFSQVDGSSMRRFGGTGLGLAICKAICEQMHGKIWFESHVNNGTTFFFNFEAEVSNAIIPITQTDLINTYKKNNKLMSLLIVDDNHVNQKIMLAFVEKLGHKADIANNGEEALQLIEKKSYDLIFMDCHMPVMDGFLATETIVKKYPNNRPKIVALTASTMQADIDHCKRSGMDDFLAKPIELDKLVNVLKKSA